MYQALLIEAMECCITPMVQTHITSLKLTLSGQGQMKSGKQ